MTETERPVSGTEGERRRFASDQGYRMKGAQAFKEYNKLQARMQLQTALLNNAIPLLKQTKQILSSRHLDRILVQRLIPKQQTPDRKRNTRPRQTKITLIPTPMRRTIPETRAQRPSHTPNHIEHANPPPQQFRRGRVPVRLCLQHVEPAGDDEENAADEVREPVDPVQDALGQVVVDAWQGEDAADVEDCRAHGEDEGGEEADFVEVVGG